MMVKVSQKKNLSCIQVIKTLLVLLENNYSMQEIVDKLNMNEPEVIFNNSTVSKYINTCRYCGVSISKINNKYYVSEMPFGLHLTLTDTDLLKNIYEVGKEFLSSRTLKKLNYLIEKLNRFSELKISSISKKSYVLSYEMFEYAVSAKRKICIMFKTGLQINCIPLRIIEVGKDVYYNVFYKNQERMINQKRLAGISMTNEKYIQCFNEQCVIFSLKGGLAQRYELRGNEILLEKSDNKIVISNKGEHKDILLSRLLRYDSLCEIISPESYRTEIQNIVNDTLKNYGIK